MVFKMCEGISYSSFSIKELDVIVHKNIFLVYPYQILAILYPTSLVNLVVEVGTRQSPDLIQLAAGMDNTIHSRYKFAKRGTLQKKMSDCSIIYFMFRWVLAS